MSSSALSPCAFASFQFAGTGKHFALLPLQWTRGFSSATTAVMPRTKMKNVRIQRKIHLPLKAMAMAPKTGGKPKKVIGTVKLALEAGKATPAPPVGPALGSKGVNIMSFCKEYNAKTADKAGYVIPAEITIYDDKSFTFVLKTPPASVLLLKAAGAEKGSNDPKNVKIGKITVDQLREIAIQKLPDLNCTSVEKAMRIVAGTAANMGVDIDPPILEPKKKEIYL
eukprot:TRINITY_DN1009_c0_g1_i1.p1 TRINITY_DN1009_c0_g1~~TRINITY_DN1009_c0_g1_i1.p1  ORF type:complete len:225 (+),score=47.36 TRINITY_DN1009_c0_g1_i1:114-788(+)